MASQALTAIQYVEIIEGHRAAGTASVKIETAADKVRRSKDNSVAYFVVKFILANGTEVPLAIKFSFDSIGQTDSLEKRKAPPKPGMKKGSPHPQLKLLTKFSKKESSTLVIRAITMIDEEIEKEVNKLKVSHGHLFPEDKKYYSTVQKRVSRGNLKAANQVMEHPIARLEFEFNDPTSPLAWKNTKFYEAKKAVLANGKITFPQEKVTNETVHEYVRSGRDADVTAIWESGSVSEFGISFKSRVASIILKGEGFTGAEDEVDETDENYAEYAELARANAAAAAAAPAPEPAPVAGAVTPAPVLATGDDINQILAAGFTEPPKA